MPCSVMFPNPIAQSQFNRVPLQPEAVQNQSPLTAQAAIPLTSSSTSTNLSIGSSQGNPETAHIDDRSRLPFRLTADFNPKIQLLGIIGDMTTSSIEGYSVNRDSMTQAVGLDVYIPNADEAKRMLESLPAGIPIITSVQTGTGQYDIHWYSLDSSGSFESTAYSDWQSVRDRQHPQPQLSQSTPIAQAVTAVLPEVQFTTQPQAAFKVVEQDESTVPIVKALLMAIPFADNVAVAFQDKKDSLQIGQQISEPVQVQVDLSSIAPVSSNEATFLDDAFWRRFDQKPVEQSDSVPAEIKFDIPEV